MGQCKFENMINNYFVITQNMWIVVTQTSYEMLNIIQYQSEDVFVLF